MANLGEFIVVYDILPELAAKMEEVVSQVVRKAAFDIQSNAAAQAPWQTGFLANSIYCEVKGGTNEHPYSGVMAPVQDGQELLPEVEAPRKPTEAVV
ncbi:MAG TPA: HK97 gp10 family phage protein, partial [Ktedonobacterales bacterium]|nr:HK97 gp10 family phage protein [Ktedonobacterales bacterium]